MMKEVIRALETGAFAEIALIAFLIAFVCILVWVFALPPSFRDKAKNMPLQDSHPLTPENNHA